MRKFGSNYVTTESNVAALNCTFSRDFIVVLQTTVDIDQSMNKKRNLRI